MLRLKTGWKFVPWLVNELNSMAGDIRSALDQDSEHSAWYCRKTYNDRLG